MEYQLKNSFLTLTVSTLGAEIQSVVDNNSKCEYIWTAKKEVWPQHAPVLFPIVGRLKNDQYTYKDKTYHLGQHGFAHKKEFELDQQDDTSITLLLKSDEETKKQYPFDFEFRVKYSLVNNLIKEDFIVTNTGSEEMIFGVGGHPGFNLPTNQGLKKEDYYFKFDPSIDHVRIPLEAPLLDWDNRSLVSTNSLFEINDQLFENDAWIFQLDNHPTKVSIKTDKSNYHINVHIDNAPYVGLWSQYPVTAYYICIEPWWGIADTKDTNGKLEDKIGMNRVAAGQTWSNGFSMAFHDETK